ncbi:MAG: hypothetical protein DBP02_19005 [gamma proteobacterium symbiont of Ctena orbiculata]|nr:MAG: hypothetical protein DBP02_19005 [gamma proteobacterium symbiont of Ctena orbiculata]PUB91149.1 MAG: hypothetical protein DBP01_03825 [gamma proteobacterium symbiont of Ctena orbiculata]
MDGCQVDLDQRVDSWPRCLSCDGGRVCLFFLDLPRNGTELGPVNTNPIGSVVSENAPIKARGVRFGDSK